MEEKKVKCPYCETEIDNNIERCPNCKEWFVEPHLEGFNLKDELTNHLKFIFWFCWDVLYIQSYLGNI